MLNNIWSGVFYVADKDKRGWGVGGPPLPSGGPAKANQPGTAGQDGMWIYSLLDCDWLTGLLCEAPLTHPSNKMNTRLPFSARYCNIVLDEISFFFCVSSVLLLFPRRAADFCVPCQLQIATAIAAASKQRMMMRSPKITTAQHIWPKKKRVKIFFTFAQLPLWLINYTVSAADTRRMRVRGHHIISTHNINAPPLSLVCVCYEAS